MSARPAPADRHAPRRTPVLALVNARASGVRRPQRQRWAVHEALHAAGADPEVRITASLDEFAESLSAAGGRRAVLVGGDGVLHAAANLGVPLPDVALIPAGRANNVARALGIPRDLRRAAALAVHGQAGGLDVLELRTPHRRVRAVEGLSAGFQAAARARYEAENSGAVAAGALALTRTLYDLPHYSARLSFDGGPVRALAFEQLFLSSMPYFAYNLHVDPAGDPGDGLGEAVVLHSATRRRAARTLLASRSGGHIGHFGTEVVPWRVARVLDPVPLAADGEPLGVAPAEVTLVRGALRLVAGPGD